MFKGLRKKASILSLSSTSSASTQSTQQDGANYPKVLKEVQDFEVALKAMDYLLDDRSDEGIKLLKECSEKSARDPSDQPASIYNLALGVMEFIEATLGFEADLMERAHKTLSSSETACLANSKYNTKHQLATSNIYPPGTEFQVTYAELTLLNALIMLLTENNGVLESAKALYKLRKAYQTLDHIFNKVKELESLFNENLERIRKEAATNPNSANLSTVDLPGYKLDTESSASLPQDLKLMKELEKVYQMRKSRVEGTNLGNHTGQVDLFQQLDHSSSDSFPSTTSSMISTSSSSTAPKHDNHLHVSTIDEFIHSGVQLCFGILQVVLSLIPPAIGRVLSIVGFRGDKEAGLKMLWRTAITSRNIHGELALMTLLFFYDGPVQFIDLGFQLPSQRDENIKNVLSIEQKTTISDSELNKILQNPTLYTPQLLTKVRKFFPHNALWILQEGRTLAGQGKLEQAIQVMQDFTDNPENKIQMKQIEALLVFDRAMLYAFHHDFEKAARDFIYLIDINSWSKGVYLFMAASCYLEQYRMIKMGLIEVSESEKPEMLQKFADLAKTYFDLAPTYVPGHGINATGKKGGIGGGNKQLPFDKFLLRKLRHIEANQKANPDLQFVDCIGTSLIHELMYFWNGYNRMTERELKISLKLLGYSAPKEKEYSANSDSATYYKIDETLDEAMIRAFLQGIALRGIGKVAEGLSLLDTEVIGKYVISEYPQFRFTKMTYSPYLYPTALSERAMFVWTLRTSIGGELDIKQALLECKNWLKKGSEVGDGDYELSNRTGFKIKAAEDSLDEIDRKANKH
ncbi:uncharacterized protein CANTADRAFT_55217 [Suhomyces tanzawaensis NRRL Y-17324]|uniref:Inclusion body clearance protein IML2 n=1 Tax=Suhomyces tanzawaensis NRRL Y-17324 TaxID=984487 RepID=A0A1E4SED8_9ASCO|nr:uncharacterized protein CANTADRAFT_55217 [Suhomyces tanzawaensis NRRL Y-17324]ODV77877.1 hypothetical protein CANTADRAFT_55217 [Suhomyces tanzawaensis NRRL Y-17324]